MGGKRRVKIEETPDLLSCLAGVRYPIGTVAAAMVGIGLSLLPTMIIGTSLRRVWGGKVDPETVVELILCVAPPLLTVVVIASMLRRLRRPRGVIIDQGQVLLLTPDEPMAEHRFDLNNLRGAALTSGTGGVDLEIQRRTGGSIRVLRGFAYEDLEPVVDLINARVPDIRHHGFEVIPLAKPAPPAGERDIIR